MDNYSKSIPRENLIMLMMASAIIVLNIVGFIIAYFVWKEYSKDSEYIETNGRLLLNFHISFVVYEVIAGISWIVFIGFILTPLVSLLYFILAIIGLINYGSHNDYKYPFIFNII
ncbi:MAG: DUF4870 domain-containing protein [Romboutsia sp.]